MNLLIKPTGDISCIYSQEIELSELGEMTVKRASMVEPAEGNDMWTADMSPVGGPLLGPFKGRDRALKAETDWLNNKMFN